ncbi:MAG TPA: hypothetical protein VIX14_03525 [Terriglobales bacterium]
MREDNWWLSSLPVMMLKGRRPELNSIAEENVRLLKDLLTKPLALSLNFEHVVRMGYR